MTDVKFKCIFMDKDGVCHGRYMGFRCIEEKCEWYGKYPIIEGVCAYWINGYCRKLRKFVSCNGKDRNCPHFKEHVEQEEYDRLFNF